MLCLGAYQILFKRALHKYATYVVFAKDKILHYFRDFVFIDFFDARDVSIFVFIFFVVCKNV